jgi:hypothetical protein
MRFVLAVILIGLTPALAKGIKNSRGAGGNLPRNKAVSAGTMTRNALVSSAVDQSQVWTVRR